MEFRTELKLEPSDKKITHSHQIMGIGSCFVNTIGQRLSANKFKTLINPFGTLFHPLAIENALLRIHSLMEYSDGEIFKHGELYFSWDHHSSFSNISKEKTLKTINSKLHNANEFIRNTDIFLLTFGTSWVYNIQDSDLFVANCHKVPQHYFTKSLLTSTQIKNSIKNCFDLIYDINPEARIITTISPVRHIKDGIIENNLSKSLLISSLWDLLNKYKTVDYFPGYELLMDDLRDYRFYKSDLIHPDKMAEDYIWQKFSDVYFDNQTKKKIDLVRKLHLALNHKPLNPGTVAYKEFLYKTEKQINNLEKSFPKDSFKIEREELQKLITYAN